MSNDKLLKEKESLMQWLERILENNPIDHNPDVKDFIEVQIKNIDQKLKE